MCAFEVLEHIEDDVAALKDPWSSYVRPGGWIMLSVPAWQERFGPMDKFVGHFRRYDPPVLRSRLTGAGLTDVELVHFGAPLGYVLEAGRNAVGKRRLASPPSRRAASMAERSEASGPHPAAVDVVDRHSRPARHPAVPQAAERLSRHRSRPGRPRPQAGGVTVADVSEHVADLADLITASPSSYHAAAEVARRLAAAGFTPPRRDRGVAHRGPRPPLRPARRRGRRLVGRRGQPDTPFRILGAHTDSPASAQAAADVAAHGWLQAGVEVYGGPLLNSWLDRELELAGRLVNRDGPERLVRTGPFLRIPQLAIHLDR